MGWYGSDREQRDREDFEDGPPGIWRWPEVTPWGTENKSDDGLLDDRLWTNEIRTDDLLDDRLWVDETPLDDHSGDDSLFDDAIWMNCESGEDPFV